MSPPKISSVPARTWRKEEVTGECRFVRAKSERWRLRRPRLLRVVPAEEAPPPRRGSRTTEVVAQGATKKS